MSVKLNALAQLWLSAHNIDAAIAALQVEADRVGAACHALNAEEYTTEQIEDAAAALAELEDTHSFVKQYIPFGQE